ncbi:hypothetical protein ACFQOY_07175 [Enterococcus alcedinis]|uniref:hypothetical protein n=1 Tax=Enterococcus alcedinis TaxID=1274384 RepID=UPI00361AAB5E
MIEDDSFSDYAFIPKPEQLNDWSEADWNFFLFMLYLFNLYTPKEVDYQATLAPQYQEELATWERLFFYFFPSEEKSYQTKRNQT